MRASVPSGSGVIAPLRRRMRSILHTGHLLGQSETTPGPMGHQYSVSPEMATSGAAGRVNLSQELRSQGQAATTTKTVPSRRKKRKRASATRRPDATGCCQRCSCTLLRITVGPPRHFSRTVMLWRMIPVNDHLVVFVAHHPHRILTENYIARPHVFLRLLERQAHGITAIGVAGRCTEDLEAGQLLAGLVMGVDQVDRWVRLLNLARFALRVPGRQRRIQHLLRPCLRGDIALIVGARAGTAGQKDAKAQGE